MKEEYNSKQIEIYQEYYNYPTDRLTEMIQNRRKYKSGVIEIIKDILKKRNAGFYPSAPAVSENPDVSGKEDTDDSVKEEPENEDGSQTVYEEVPWLNRNPVFIPGITGAAGDFINEARIEDVNGIETEVDIEAEQQKYWKCPKCGELVEMEYDVCWNCQAEMPKTVEHPDKEEIIQEIKEKSVPLNTLPIGVILILLGVVVFFVERSRNQYFHDIFHSDLFLYIFVSIFPLVGLYFVISSFFKKSDKKD